MTIKNIKFILGLSTSQMAEIKGGADITTTVVAIVKDDKRPPRPGGGITTL
jgi:hypothetical protein